MMAIAALFAVGSIVESALAQEKQNVPKPQDKVALSADEVKQLVLMMDTEDLEEGVHGLYVGGIRQTGQGQEWRIGRERAFPIGISPKFPAVDGKVRPEEEVRKVPC
jgi:hypothetical protein